MDYEKIIRQKLIKEEIDLNQYYREIKGIKKRIKELNSLSTEQKAKEWERLVITPLKEELKEKEEEFNNLLKEKDGNNI